uniref:Guanylate kinase-like domain-containing protein n=1 Tax=Globodera pallida TaxID=36090 RepID=A0A183CBW0_GLOPA
MPSSPSATTRVPPQHQHQQQQQQQQLNEFIGAAGERRMSFGSELALQHGVHFEGKYIGSMEIARPGTHIKISSDVIKF